MSPDFNECFESEPGVPTLTIQTTERERLFPYSSFRMAEFTGHQIVIELFDWRITIVGQRLDALWRELQLQDVRLIRVLADEVDGSCWVSEVQITPTEEDS